MRAALADFDVVSVEVSAAFADCYWLLWYLPAKTERMSDDGCSVVCQVGKTYRLLRIVALSFFFPGKRTIEYMKVTGTYNDRD